MVLRDGNVIYGWQIVVLSNKHGYKMLEDIDKFVEIFACRSSLRSEHHITRYL